MRHPELKFLLISFTVMLLFSAHLSAGRTPPEYRSDGMHDHDHASTLTITAKQPGNTDADDHYVFEMSRHEIPSGWTSIDFHNESDSTHFGYIVRVDDEDAELTREQYIKEGSSLFQAAWSQYFAGEINVEEMFTLMMPTLPEWFHGLVSSGGPGLLGAHQSSRTTINLAPGTYFIECYILDTRGVFHISHGMVERLVVTEEVSDAGQPLADLQVSISSTEGIAFDEENVRPGLKTFEVTFEDNIHYAHGMGHDVHLIRLDGDTSVSQINDWMGYLDAGGDGYYANRGALISSSAAAGPETFLGGVQSIFADEARGRAYPQTAYFRAVLTPGRYALVAEVPNPMQPDPDNPEMSMLVEFNVTPFAGPGPGMTRPLPGWTGTSSAARSRDDTLRDPVCCI